MKSPPFGHPLLPARARRGSPHREDEGHGCRTPLGSGDPEGGVGLVGSVREAVGWARALTRGRRHAAAPRPTAGPGAPPRPAVRRPDSDPALAARLSRWRAPADRAPAGGAPMTARQRAAAMRQLEELRPRLEGRPAEAVSAALAAGEVTVRSLGSADGHVWELPGLRVFAIVGVQAFTVEDEPG